ncbi:MAG: alpha/beta hydrolase [Deltaproteobacteria bacterium]|nr:alpha/beta hydrolase [Deltaproteobacteria bacterium]
MTRRGRRPRAALRLLTRRVGKRVFVVTPRGDPPGRFVRVDGMRVHVEDRGGEGPPILLLHGYLGSTATWYPAIPHLLRGLRVVAVDLPGSGFSDRPRGVPYTLPWFAELLPRIVRAVGIDRPIIAAHSWGAALALHALAEVPDLARALVLVSPMVRGDRAPPGLRVAEKLPGLARAFFRSPVGHAVLPALVRRAGFTPKDPHAGLRARRLAGHLDAPGGWEAATDIGLRAALHAPGPEVLERVIVPVLLVWGRDDPIHSPEVGRGLLPLLGGPAEFVELPASHNCHDEAAELFAQNVLRWVSAREQ